MLRNEKISYNNLIVKRNRTKRRKTNISQLSSEIRTIIKCEEENNKVDKNNEINKIDNFQRNINNINIYNIKEKKRNSERKSSKKSSFILNNRRGSIIGNNKKEDNDIIEEEKEDELNLRQKITKFLETNNRLFYIQLLVSILSIISALYYVICTYINKLFKSLNYIDFFVCSFYLIEHIINILISPHFFSYIFSIESLLSFFIEIPPFFSFLCNNFHLSSWYRFINITRIFRLIKGYKIIEIFKEGEKSVNFQIFNIIAILIEIVFIWAGIIQMVDLLLVEKDLPITFGALERRNLLLRIHFHHYVYFIIVSLTTVGYGEILPLSILGKFMIICLVFIILVVIPEQTNELINLSNSQTIYERKKYLSIPGISFVILLGDIELESLKSFSKEYFDKTQGNPFKHIVILRNKAPDRETELFLNKEENFKYIIYLQGDPMNDNDLLRCDILHANSCIIFTNKNCIDPHSSDHQSLLLAISIKKFYYQLNIKNNISENNDSFYKDNSINKDKSFLKNNHFRIILQLNRAENCIHYFSTLQSTYKRNMLNDKLLIIESFKMNLISKSCMTPGIISLISNLVISSSFDLDFFKNEIDWLTEYSEGQQYEIIKLCTEGDLLNYSFQKLAMEIYNKFHSLLIALEITYKGSSLIKLNPITNNTLNEIINSVFGLSNREKTNMENFDIDDPSLSFLEEGKNNELQNDNYNNTINEKKYELDRKKIKIFLYFICDGKETKNEIQKLDKKRKLKNKSSMQREKTSNNILETLPLNIFNKNKKPNKTYTKSNKSENLEKTMSYYSSDSENEEDINDNMKYLYNQGNIGSFFNIDELREHYYLLNDAEKNNLYSNEIAKIGIEGRNDIKHHIIICGMHHEIIHLILHLRAKYIPEQLLKWIVILSNYLPQDIHDILCNFQKVIFIQGDPLNPDNLYKVNISYADIAVIFSNNDKDLRFFDNQEIIGRDEDELNEKNNYNENENNNNKEDGDAKILFIYKSIKKLNNSIKIITELSNIKNIELLHTFKDLKKLKKYSKIAKNNKYNNKSYNNIINDKNENETENIAYEYTPIYASGEVFLPSLIDKITGQMYHKEFLYNILNLLLNGEKVTQKSSDKKLSQLFNNLTNSNLFLIPSDSRSESFGDMFNRLLTRNKIISIALYRKNDNENFYYVYTNPKKTTLIKDSDFVFVLSSTENILNLVEKNIMNLGSIKENDKKLNVEEIENKININKNEEEKLLKEFLDSLPQKKEIIEIKKNKAEMKRRISIFIDKSNSDKKNRNRENSIIIGDNNKGKYAEINRLQNILNKEIKNLKNINRISKDTPKDINNYVKEGIYDEFLVYLNNKINSQK